MKVQLLVLSVIIYVKQTFLKSCFLPVLGCPEIYARRLRKMRFARFEAGPTDFLAGFVVSLPKGI